MSRVPSAKRANGFLLPLKTHKQKIPPPPSLTTSSGERRQTTKRSIVLGASTSFVHLCLPFVDYILRLSMTQKLYKIQIDKERCVLRVIYMSLISTVAMQ